MRNDKKRNNKEINNNYTEEERNTRQHDIKEEAQNSLLLVTEYKYLTTIEVTKVTSVW